MAALHRVNYALFVLFVTIVIILAGALLGGDVNTASTQRVAATVLGSAIAIIGIGLERTFLDVTTRVRSGS